MNLEVLQLLKLNLRKSIKGGPNKVQGVKNVSKFSKRGDVYKAPKKLCRVRPLSSGESLNQRGMAEVSTL